MRPLKLTMTAFGPYIDKTVIDMDSLGDSGLYLITGDTGAGKTTIFDAIVYALYGEASGDTRKPSMFRSQGASPNTVTEVILTFLYDGKEYTIKRTPEYMRPKMTGADKGKLIKQVASVELIMPDGRTTITKNQEVKDAIQDLLGVNCDQFRQIAMIAQGEFRKILFATTDEREKIFSTLFKTDMYKHMQERLKERFLAVNKSLDEAKLAQAQYIDGVICTSENLIDLWKTVKMTAIPEEVIDFLKSIIADDEKKLEAVVQTVESTEEKLSAAVLALENIKKYDAVKKSLDMEKQALATESQKTAVLLENLEKARDDAKGIEALEQRAAELQIEIGRHDEIKRLLAEYTALQTTLKKQSEALLLLEKRLTSETEKQKLLEAEAQTLAQAGAQKERLLRERTVIVTEQADLTEFNRLYEEHRTLCAKLAKAQISYLSVSQLYDKAKQEYESKSKAFLDAQAGILAENLAENTPCPVCGSLTHPMPARKSETAPSEAEWKASKKKYDQAEAERTESATVCATLRGETENVKSTLDMQCAAIFGEESTSVCAQQIEERKRALQEKYDALTSAVRMEEQNIKRKESLELLLPTMAGNLEKIRAEINHNQAQTASFAAKAEEKQEQMQALRAQLQFETKTDAEKQQRAYEMQKNAYRLALQNAETVYNDNQRRIAAIAAKTETLEKSLPAVPEKTLLQAQEDVALLTMEKKRAVHEKEGIIARLSPNRQTLDNLCKNIVTLKNLEEKYSWMKALSDTANGTLRGKEKVRLETYVQKTYLERILIRANRRLRIMTDDQYELKCREEAESKVSKSGLELNVIDHYNGTERDVRSLSGGESFKASLALALGLSDEIQASAGGIRLDTMFVDEGFGSLDDASLDYAMRALSDLTEGGRLVGIISHVGALKDKITRQVIVKKEKDNGSTVTVTV